MNVEIGLFYNINILPVVMILRGNPEIAQIIDSKSSITGCSEFPKNGSLHSNLVIFLVFDFASNLRNFTSLVVVDVGEQSPRALFEV
jgi:hypothetical protein